jgi:hypothetical protein
LLVLAAYPFVPFVPVRKEVDVKRLLTRAAAVAVVATLGLGGAVTPCLAADKPAPATQKATQKKTASLTQLSGSSQSLLMARSPRAQQSAQEPPSSPSGFFKSKRGAVTLALMGAGVGFTLWSIHHDRQPVKSPVR